MKKLLSTVVAVVFIVMLMGQVVNIQSYEGVDYDEISDVLISFPPWENSSTTNVAVSDGTLKADQNDYGKWVSEPLRINDNRKIVYEADVSTVGSIGLTIQTSDNSTFNEVRDVRKFNLEDGFNEEDLDLKRTEYTRLVIEFDKAADSADGVNSLNLQGVRTDNRTSFGEVVSLVLVLLLFYFFVRIFYAGIWTG